MKYRAFLRIVEYCLTIVHVGYCMASSRHQKEMYMTCNNVIFAVGIALVSLLYFSVFIATNWISVLFLGNGPRKIW